MLNDGGVENRKYKLLGFEKSKNLAVVMVISTGRIVKLKLAELLKSEIFDDLNKIEIKEVYKKFYSGGAALTIYDVSDRHERSWMIYLALSFALFALYIFTNISAGKLVHVELFDLVVTPGVFLYPLTFLIVDLLNEFFGLRLAKKSILFVFLSGLFVMLLLSATSRLPGLAGWELDESYDNVIAHVSSALIASSVSFLLSEYVNSYLLNRIKQLTNSRYLFLRVFLSTFFAIIIDSFVFCVIAFYGKLDAESILEIIYVQLAIKVCFAVLSIMPAYAARLIFRKYVSGAQPT